MDGLISLEEAIMTTDNITPFDEFNEVDIDNNGFFCPEEFDSSLKVWRLYWKKNWIKLTFSQLEQTIHQSCIFLFSFQYLLNCFLSRWRKKVLGFQLIGRNAVSSTTQNQVSPFYTWFWQQFCNMPKLYRPSYINGNWLNPNIFDQCVRVHLEV